LQNEVEKAIKLMRDKKATGYDDTSGDVLPLLGESGLRIVTQLINNIYETAEWPKDFTAVTMIALRKKNGARRVHEIEYRIVIEIAAFNKKKTLCTSKFDLHLRDKLVICYIWNVYWYGAETWTLWKADQKYLGSFGVWCWRRMEQII